MKKCKFILAYLAIIFVFQMPVLNVSAATVYISDNIPHEEGFIIIGESHALLAAAEFNRMLNEEKECAVDDLAFSLNVDSSIAVNQNSEPDTFIMKGNLFFVFEGNSDNDFAIQIQRNYIYSDGKGKQGGAVKKIHEIMDTNPNIKHWNIISWHGATAIRKGNENADYYVNSYHNWINYEFPDADIYILSHSTITKSYRNCKKQADYFNETLKKAFPDNYLDYTDFFAVRYPQDMLDPELKADLVHWNLKTYWELFQDAMLQALARRDL